MIRFFFDEDGRNDDHRWWWRWTRRGRWGQPPLRPHSRKRTIRRRRLTGGWRWKTSHGRRRHTDEDRTRIKMIRFRWYDWIFIHLPAVMVNVTQTSPDGTTTTVSYRCCSIRRRRSRRSRRRSRRAFFWLRRPRMNTRSYVRRCFKEKNWINYEKCKRDQLREEKA